MHNRSQPACELTLELGEADEFFAGSESNVAAGRPALPPGIDQIREELDARSLPDALATVIVLPNDQVKPGLSADFARAVDRYCAMGIEKAEREIKHLRREGFRTLMIGLTLFVVFVAIAEALGHTGLPSPIRNLLAEDGLFIVVGWVGLWYPIETLLYSHRPYRQEIAVLQLIRRMQIEIRPASQLAQASGAGSAGMNVPKDGLSTVKRYIHASGRAGYLPRNLIRGRPSSAR